MNSNRLTSIFDKYINRSEELYFDFSVALVDYFRQQSKAKLDIITIEPLLAILSENEEYRSYLSKVLVKLIVGKDFDQILSDSGIINYSDFYHEVKKRLVEKILPYQPAQESLEFTLNQVFYDSKDPIWIEKIPVEQLAKLLDILDLKTIYDLDHSIHPYSELLYALEILTQRVTGLAFEPEITKMVPESRNFDSPFLGLQREMMQFIDHLREKNISYLSSDNLYYKQIFVLLHQCEKYIDNAYSNSNKLGISMTVNQSLLKVRQQISRIKEALTFISINDEQELTAKHLEFIKYLISINCNKTNVKKLVKESTQAVAYEITQHKANTGEHYITANKKEYLQMLYSACVGGFIVGIMCITKLLLGKINTSEFGHAFYYSMNYSIGFIAIYLVGGTLATKQPSMTASALASSLEKNAKTPDGLAYKYWSFATFFSQVFRSQFIAFLGNIFLAFPVALLLVWSIDKLTNINIASEKWKPLLTDLNPITSPAIFHACIAGVFLFLSGIIAGSVANKDKFNSVYYRIQQHPILKRIIGKKKTARLADWYQKKWAGIISNFWFGVFMGSTGSIGLFLGLDIDIRHITFASGNIALGIFGSDFKANIDLIIWGVVGMTAIGFFNFIVSFVLSFSLALKARQISYSDLLEMFKAVWALFKINPKQFFLPPKS